MSEQQPFCQATQFPGLVPTAIRQRVKVVEHVRMARDTWRLRLHCPDIARQIRPGQFFMVRDPRSSDPLLGRPFALYDICEEGGEPLGVDFGYVVIGKLTRLMTDWQPGTEVELWGPLGNGFPPPQPGRLLMVAGGIGQTPFLATAREALGLQTYADRTIEPQTLPDRVTLQYGVRSADYLAGLDDFNLPGLNIQVSTDDGSHGHHGYVTEMLAAALESNQPPTHVYVCGPEIMMHAAAKLCAQAGVDCWLSLETPMACGFGACFSCVTRVRQDDGTWDYRRTCIEGPVFPAEQLELA